MAVTIQIPTALRGYTERKSEVELDASSVGEAIGKLAERYPDLRQFIFHEGELRSFVKVFVGGESIKDLGGLDTPLKDHDTVVLVPAIAGGR